MIHELEVEVEHSGVGVVKVNCSESYVVALLADSSVSVWDRSKGTLTNAIRMVGTSTCLPWGEQAGNRLLTTLPDIFSLFSVSPQGGYTHDIAFLSDSHIALALLVSGHGLW